MRTNRAHDDAKRINKMNSLTISDDLVPTFHDLILFSKMSYFSIANDVIDRKNEPTI